MASDRPGTQLQLQPLPCKPVLVTCCAVQWSKQSQQGEGLHICCPCHGATRLMQAPSSTKHGMMST